MDDTAADNALLDQLDEQAADRYAENGWLRMAEAGNYETWAETDLDRMIDLQGFGPPPLS